MKRIIQLIAIVLPLIAGAQAERAPAANEMQQRLLRTTPSVNTTNALFDLQFNHSLGRAGFAGVVWLHSQYWVSKYNSDSLFTVNKTTGAITSTFFITN